MQRSFKADRGVFLYVFVCFLAPCCRLFHLCDGAQHYDKKKSAKSGRNPRPSADCCRSVSRTTGEQATINWTLDLELKSLKEKKT